MRSHIAFFLLGLSYLTGVALGNFGITLELATLTAIILLALLYAGRINLMVSILASILLFLGSAYYIWDDYRYQAAIAKVPSSATLQGTISEDPKHEIDYQLFYVRTSFGKIMVETDPTPRYEYGEVISVLGKIVPPNEKHYGRHIVGVMRKPTIEEVSFAGNPILARLFAIKNSIRTSYERVLSPQQAALLFGILFGSTEGLSKEFSNSLSTSGLRFITAIDGLHMQIMLVIILGIFGYFLPRRCAYLSTFVLAILFIALTGFTISGIRSALMAFITRLGAESGRLYVPHNALILAAIVLTLINPKVILYDLGFQLSFIAVIAIIYLMPVIRWALHLSEDPGFLELKQSLLITVAVQLATAPLLIMQFQNFSLTSFLASVTIVWVLYFILIFGFLLAFLSALPVLAYLFSFIVAPLMEYVIFIVNTAAHFAVSFNPPLGILGLELYYGALLLIVYWFHREKTSVVRSADTQ